MDEEEPLDGETCFKLKILIETITHSGLKMLDEKLFKEVKKICRVSSGTTKKTYSLILYQLKKNHSEIRHLAFQMIVELFKRSALFRELVIKELQLIYELSAGTNPKKKLPPPKTVANMLEKLALSTIKRWNDEFGDTFKEIKIAYSYLKHSKKVNFDEMIANNEIDLQRQRQESALKEEKMQKLLQDIKSNEPEIENTLISLTNCLTLLVPSPDNFFINDVKMNTTDEGTAAFERHDDEDENINLKHFGITSNYGIIINQSCSKLKVKKTDENSAVIQNAEDNMKLIKNRFLPMIKKWNQICVKYSTDNGSTIQQILKLKDKLDSAVNKFKQLNIQNVNDNTSDNSSDEFEEVTKEHYENSVQGIEDFDIVNSHSPTSEKKLETTWRISLGEDGDPTSALSTLKSVQQRDSGNIDNSSSSKKCNSTSSSTPSKEISRKDKLLALAPKLPFDIDLYHWEDQNLTVPTLLSIKMDNPKFWGVSSVDDLEEIPNPDGVAALRTRVIEFSGKFEPVKWSCRAPLPNGKLCPRKDRFKCPFHGKIIARDEKGIPKDVPGTSDNKRSAESDWQDPELLEDIKNATGVDLTMLKKKLKSNKRVVSKTHKIMKTSLTAVQDIEKQMFPGLTDTIGTQDNAYKRLSKKIFKRSALNKVAATLNKIDFVKHRDKFGDQFNYVYGT